MMQKHTKFLRLAEVQKLVPYSTPHIWRLEKDGLFPRRIKIGANRVAWSAAEIEAWLESKLEERDNG